MSRTQLRQGTRSRFRPAVEALEQRYALACELSFSAGELRITGDYRDNAVDLSDNGAGTVTATCDGSTATFSNVNFIRIDLRAGRDHVQHRFTGPTTRAIEYNVDLGWGDDVFISQTSQGFQADTRVFVDCQEGADRVHFLWTGTVDTFSLVDSVDAYVLGGDGDDTMTLDAELDAVRGNLFLLLVGQTGKDDLDLTYSGDLDTLLTCGVLGLENDDDLTMQLYLQPGSSGNVDANMEGGSGDDELFFRVSKVLFKDRVTIDARLKGGLGNDTATYSAAFVVLQDNIETTSEL